MPRRLAILPWGLRQRLGASARARAPSWGWASRFGFERRRSSFPVAHPAPFSQRIPVPMLEFWVMRIPRRTFFLVLLLAAFLQLTFLRIEANPAATKDYLVYVGTYTTKT